MLQIISTSFLILGFVSLKAHRTPPLPQPSQTLYPPLIAGIWVFILGGPTWSLFCVHHLLLRHLYRSDSLLALLDKLRRRFLWVTHLNFSSKQESQQLGPLLPAGGNSAVLFAEGRDEILVTDSLFVFNKGPLSFVSYAGGTQFLPKIFLPLIDGPFASHHHILLHGALYRSLLRRVGFLL